MMNRMPFREFPLSVKAAIVFSGAAWAVDIISGVVCTGRISLFPVTFAFLFVTVSFSRRKTARWTCVAASIFMILVLSANIYDKPMDIPSLPFYTVLIELILFSLSAIFFSVEKSAGHYAGTSMD